MDKIDTDLIETLNIKNIASNTKNLNHSAVRNDSSNNNSFDNKNTFETSKLGWVSYVPGESRDFVSGDKALKILDDGEASFNSEHKFSLRESFVASSLNGAGKSTNNTKGISSMIDNNQ